MLVRAARGWVQPDVGVMAASASLSLRVDGGHSWLAVVGHRHVYLGPGVVFPSVITWAVPRLAMTQFMLGEGDRTGAGPVGLARVRGVLGLATS